MQTKIADTRKMVRNDHLQFHTVYNYTTFKGVEYKELTLSFQTFGKPLSSAPVVLINHALTGNSDVAGNDRGWWKELVGKGKLIDTDKFTVIAFNILGNGYDGMLITNYKDFIAKDIARLQHLVLSSLGVGQLFAAIGGSLGGCLNWELAALQPQFIKNLIPIASDWKSTDWIVANTSVQEAILTNSKHPLQDARMMAMLFYRTPQSLTQKFSRLKNENTNRPEVGEWLQHHGKKLEHRFELSSYLMMNHLLSTVDIEDAKQGLIATLYKVESNIIQIAIDNDLFFIKEENNKTHELLNKLSKKNEYHEIQSIHGHDAFLIEHEQISKILHPVFNQNNKLVDTQGKCGKYKRQVS